MTTTVISLVFRTNTIKTACFWQIIREAIHFLVDLHHPQSSIHDDTKYAFKKTKIFKNFGFQKES